MTKLEIIRAWKDDEYVSNLSQDEKKLLPQNPAGLVELPDDELRVAVGAKDFIGSCYSCLTCNTVGCDMTAITVSPASA